jgi:hypothetical protein
MQACQSYQHVWHVYIYQKSKYFIDTNSFLSDSTNAVAENNADVCFGVGVTAKRREICPGESFTLFDLVCNCKPECSDKQVMLNYSRL